MTPGIRNIVGFAGDQTITASTTLVSVGFTAAIKKGSTHKLRAWVPITVGASGGVKYQVVMSQTPAKSVVTTTLQNTVAPSTTIACQVDSLTAFSNALANAGNHFLTIEIEIQGNEALDSTLDLQFACNSAAGALVVLQGAVLEEIQYTAPLPS